MIRAADLTDDPHIKVLLILSGILETAEAAGLPRDLSEAYYAGISKGLTLAGDEAVAALWDDITLMVNGLGP
jgi:hypothetical protein